MLERFSTVLGAAGIGCFALAWVLEGWLPLHHLGKIPIATLDEIAPVPNEAFYELAGWYPESFKEAYGEPTKEAFHKALSLGRDVYIAEGCWHCHSQFVRPVSNEDIRFGPVATAAKCGAVAHAAGFWRGHRHRESVVCRYVHTCRRWLACAGKTSGTDGDHHCGEQRGHAGAGGWCLVVCLGVLA